jgi:hypothetical protein
MNKIYKIHPAIGFARVGDSPGGILLGQETPDGPVLEIANNKEKRLKKYKDGQGRLKRKVARFRIFEYEQDDAGQLSNAREITEAEAVIEWTVELANTKAAGPIFSLNPNETQLRNPGVSREKLSITPGHRSISGGNQPAVRFDTGKFKRTKVYLGELRTDVRGRLLVFGGRGFSASPSNDFITDFANNDNWFDDTADGRVTAQITFPGQAPVAADQPAWVIVAPPDFAPNIAGITTLYDIALQAAVSRGWLQLPAQTSFRQHVFPMLDRAFHLRWTNTWDQWNHLPHDWPSLADPSSSGSAAQRQTWFSFLTNQPLNSLKLTDVQTQHLKRWRDGNAVNDWLVPQPPQTAVTPENLDRAALEQAVGGGFFPGIEAGILMTRKEIYVEPFRLDSTRFKPGEITQRMAVPWQADFTDCRQDWWPSQRPDIIMVDRNASRTSLHWAGGIGIHEDMVKFFARLGVVVPAKNSAGEEVFVEKERDPTFVRD